MNAQPNVFVGLTDDCVVVGFEETAPLQVWDLAAAKLVRKLDGSGKCCRALARLPDRRRIAVGWNNCTVYVVAIFDVATGKRLQELMGFEDEVVDIALVDDHMLTLATKAGLRVWCPDFAGQVRCQARMATF